MTSVLLTRPSGPVSTVTITCMPGNLCACFSVRHELTGLVIRWYTGLNGNLAFTAETTKDGEGERWTVF